MSLIVGTFIIIAAIGQEIGNFTVAIEQSNESLTMAANASFSEPTSRLFAENLESAFNISEEDIPDDVDSGSSGGAHNGTNYIAYTFYLKNVSESALNYSVTATITDEDLVDAAIRYRLYENGVLVGTYAKANTVLTEIGAEDTRECIVGDRTGSNATLDYMPTCYDSSEPANETFQGYATSFVGNTILDYTYSDFASNAFCKYTFVIWLEGNDPDCNDSINGGKIKIKLSFKVVSEVVE